MEFDVFTHGHLKGLVDALQALVYLEDIKAEGDSHGNAAIETKVIKRIFGWLDCADVGRIREEREKKDGESESDS